MLRRSFFASLVAPFAVGFRKLLPERVRQIGPYRWLIPPGPHRRVYFGKFFVELENHVPITLEANPGHWLFFNQAMGEPFKLYSFSITPRHPLANRSSRIDLVWDLLENPAAPTR